ncbi:hypothetical protein PPERSA_10166 [Pseudocohnilembus persalinus]|uniref:Uncharacterized protein n=1 Tax=Pseudocohnilembus persalinus TaxID=266149 RepID=A0A0V0QLH5_PSEPJ|nr:hypothetical protein PPERSA_10166 [Pseudocohnilembus persalinus]|eukprot:KRX03085.1 hypothetical protein PPERSA_10166 [Pseudocohnilembus persalinus]
MMPQKDKQNQILDLQNIIRDRISSYINLHNDEFNELQKNGTKGGFQWKSVSQEQYPLQFEINGGQNFGKTKQGWVWYKNLTIPMLSITLSKNNNYQTALQDQLFANIYCMKKLRCNNFDKVGLKDDQQQMFTDGNAQFKSLKFNETTLMSRSNYFILIIYVTNKEGQILGIKLSPPFQVDGRRKYWMERESVTQVMSPFKPEKLDKGFEKVDKKDNSAIQIGEDLKSLFDYYSSQTIRRKIRNPFFLLLRFPKAVRFFVNNNLIQQSDNATLIKNIFKEIETALKIQLKGPDAYTGIENKPILVQLKSSQSDKTDQNYTNKLGKYLYIIDNAACQYQNSIQDVPDYFREVPFSYELKEQYKKIHYQLQSFHDPGDIDESEMYDDHDVSELSATKFQSNQVSNFQKINQSNSNLNNPSNNHQQQNQQSQQLQIQQGPGTPQQGPQNNIWSSYSFMGGTYGNNQNNNDMSNNQGIQRAALGQTLLNQFQTNGGLGSSFQPKFLANSYGFKLGLGDSYYSRNEGGQQFPQFEEMIQLQEAFQQTTPGPSSNNQNNKQQQNNNNQNLNQNQNQQQQPFNIDFGKEINNINLNRKPSTNAQQQQLQHQNQQQQQITNQNQGQNSLKRKPQIQQEDLCYFCQHHLYEMNSKFLLEKSNQQQDYLKPSPQEFKYSLKLLQQELQKTSSDESAISQNKNNNSNNNNKFFQGGTNNNSNNNIGNNLTLQNNSYNGFGQNNNNIMQNNSYNAMGLAFSKQNSMQQQQQQQQKFSLGETFNEPNQFQLTKPKILINNTGTNQNNQGIQHLNGDERYCDIKDEN